MVIATWMRGFLSINNKCIIYWLFSLRLILRGFSIRVAREKHSIISSWLDCKKKYFVKLVIKAMSKKLKSVLLCHWPELQTCIYLHICIFYYFYLRMTLIFFFSLKKRETYWYTCHFCILKHDIFWYNWWHAWKMIKVFHFS